MDGTMNFNAHSSLVQCLALKMDHDEALLIASSAVIILAYNELQESKKRKRRQRRWWHTNLFYKRNGDKLMRDLKFQEISGQYKNFTRMSSSSFEDLLVKIAPNIRKEDTNMREAISVQDRFAVTLRFLATGDSYSSLQYTFRISKQSISQIVPEVCPALVEELKENIKLPRTPSEWMAKCEVFEQIWDFMHCTAAIDGKHVLLQAPITSGSEFFNYKSQFSIVLLALVDGDYNFLFADVGCQGRISDSGMFNNSKLCQMVRDNSLGFPEATELPGRQVKVPYFIAADSAFALQENIMKPYGGVHRKGSCKRVFNYRLSRARRVVENAFGIMSSVFRVLRKPLLLEPEKAQIVVTTIICLHNYLRQHSQTMYTPHGALDYEDENGIQMGGSWRNDPDNMSSMLSLQRTPRRSATAVEKIRDELADYYSHEGALPWQDEYA